MSATEKKTGEKKNAFEPLVRFFKEVRGELRKVVYPTLKQVRKNTTVVIVVVILVGLFIAGLDFVFNGGRNYLITNDKTSTDQTQQTSTSPQQQIPQGDAPQLDIPQADVPQADAPQQEIPQQAPAADEGSNQ